MIQYPNTDPTSRPTIPNNGFGYSLTLVKSRVQRADDGLFSAVFRCCRTDSWLRSFSGKLKQSKTIPDRDWTSVLPQTLYLHFQRCLSQMNLSSGVGGDLAHPPFGAISTT